MDYKKIAKPLILLIAIIILCSVLTRVFSGSETLNEYAAKNPELAYQEKEETANAAQEKGSTGQPPAHTVNNDPKLSPAEDSSPESGNAVREGKETAPESEDAVSKAGNDGPNIKAGESNTDSEDEAMTTAPDRIVYKQGFYYEPLSEELKKRITGVSYPVTESAKDSTMGKAVNIVSSEDEIQISYDDLRYVSVLYYNFKGIERTGELICNKAVAQDFVEIFYELYRNEYQIEQIALIDEYGGDDTLSMQDNNTSCFNYRVVDGTSSLSKHALGLAIDINPFYNPYVVYKNDGSAYISPQGSETYADRSKDFAYKIDENDLCYKLFKEHGFTWGGDWNSLKDYQHFQKVPK